MIYLIVAYILNIIDYIFTAHWVHNFGIEIEANPFGRWLFEHNMTWLFKIFIVGGLFALIGVLIKKCPKAVIGAKSLLMVYALIVAYHLCILGYVVPIGYGDPQGGLILLPPLVSST